jgi:uncharacterized protein with NAD-binding domain and iron-sulfur cluster
MARKQIAILGGGIAALSAAFELTELDPNNEMFDITVYTIGWRLGGKGAVGRNAAKGYRAEEHGLHVWTGFYDNAFQLVDRVYAAQREQDIRPPFGGRESAFKGLNHCVLMEPAGLQDKPDPCTDWNTWVINLVPHEGLPGTPRDYFFSPTEFLRSLIESSAELMKPLRSLLADKWPESGYPGWTTDAERQAGPFSAAQARIASLPSDPLTVTRRQSEELQMLLQNSIEPVQKAALSAVGEDRKSLILCEIALVIMFGMLRDEVIWNGFDCIDDFEWKEWMLRNGCCPDTLKSAIVRGCYDYVFGFVRGQTDVGAGTGTRILLKLMFAYRGSFFYLLRATMGELIFAPLYQVLCHRKVKFNFFTRIDSIELSTDGESVEFIQTTIQARPKKSTYYPLIEIPDGTDQGYNIPTWPSEPVYCRLQDGEHLHGVDFESAWSPWRGVGCETLKLGTHFDEVVLGISIGAFGTICRDLICQIPRWERMTTAVKTTATTAFQAWTTKTTCELGAKTQHTVSSGFQLPFDSWGDLSLMLPMEKWPTGKPPEGLAYFVGCLSDACLPPSSDPDSPKKALDQAKAATLDWINKYLFRLWPNVVDAQHQVQWDRFFDPENGHEEERLEAQYLRVNINPSDRYVLSVKGSVSARMRADESGVDNLYLAGDWVRTGINAGCIEASVMAGRAAAAAIAGVPLTMPNSTDFDSNNLPTQLIPLLDIARKLGDKAVAGTGEIEAFCVLVSLPVDFVEGQLPNGLALHVSKGSHAAPLNHEVAFIFARQRNVRPGLIPFGGADYFEVAELIPDVVLSDATDSQSAVFSYMPHLLVDSLPATLIGQQFYGFNKQLARITLDGDAFNVRSPVGNLKAGFNRVGLPGSISDFPQIGHLRSKLEQPLVGVKKDGNFAFSILNFGLNAAVFQLAGGTVNIRPPFVPPKKPQQQSQQQHKQQDPYDIELNGATGDCWGFRFLSRWTLSLPFDSPAGKTSDTERNLSKITAGYGRAVLGRFLLPRG